MSVDPGSQRTMESAAASDAVDPVATNQQSTSTRGEKNALDYLRQRLSSDPAFTHIMMQRWALESLEQQIATLTEALREICVRIEAKTEAETYREVSIARSRKLDAVYAIAESALAAVRGERPKCNCYPWEGIHAVDCPLRGERT